MIGYEVAEKVATLTIMRAEVLNALDVEAMTELRARLIQARDDPRIRVIILTGAGDRSFCVGADLSATFPTETSFAETFWRSDDDSAPHGAYVRLLDISRLRLWKPIVAAINGHCVGGGLELAMQADIRVASPNATFGLTEAKVGSIPAAGGLHRLLRGISPAVGMKMVLTGDRISAEEALRVGLVSDLFAQEELRQCAWEIADRIAANAPLAVQAIKRLAWEGSDVPLSTALLLDEMTWGMLRDTHDRIEGRTAFTQKRDPHYEGR